MKTDETIYHKATETIDCNAPFDEDTSIRFVIEAMTALRLPEPVDDGMSFIQSAQHREPAASNAARYHVLKGVEIELQRLMMANALSEVHIEEKEGN